ncbi:MAG: hypothetical protein AAB658_06125, partial [Chloroflexota bacterium]
MSPNAVRADDFISDGRPVSGVRWWGSELAPPSPDGWLISFHEPLAKGGSAAEPLGLYFCDANVVGVRATTFTSCDLREVRMYIVALEDCCLLAANVDSRGGVPAQADGFYEEQCRAYDIDIQAALGYTYVVSGGCVQTATGNSATNPFWGWHTTGVSHGNHLALQSTVATDFTDWLYGPWANFTPTCSGQNMAFQLRTRENATRGDCDDNGFPDVCETGTDCQPNGVFDQCDLADGNSQDCNDNAVPDECDIAGGFSEDCQPNGIPDECDVESVASLTSAIAAVLGFVDISGTGVPLNLADDAA